MHTLHERPTYIRTSPFPVTKLRKELNELPSGKTRGNLWNLWIKIEIRGVAQFGDTTVFKFHPAVDVRRE